MADDHTEELTRREGRAPNVETTPAVATTTGRLSRGTAIDRYFVIDVLGSGGMGVVYSAFDPELGRKVAIKLLDTEPAAEEDPNTTAALRASRAGGEQARLVREARALAQLSHPNVVAVHDVGTIRGDQVFVAMELVEGQNLREWFRAAKRGWRDVLPVLRAAGEGLAAAHTGGMVHRDFKPENVLVGDDGRVRVTDFGLARHHTEPVEPAVAARRSSGRLDPVTDPHTLMGTPAYMAPELYEHADANARSDQFAFGVTLYEGLFGDRPYKPPAFDPPKLPDHAVPAKIVDVVMRTIAIDPSTRFASMADVLRELAVDPHRTRRRVLVALGGIAVAAGVTLPFALRSRSSELCANTERRLAGVWDPEVSARTKAAFLATNKPNAEKSFIGFARALDAHTAKWTRTAHENCRATRVHEDQTEEVMALREHCLSQRLEELRAFTQLAGTAGGAIVDKGETAVHELQSLELCNNVTALRQPGLPPADKAAQVAELEKTQGLAYAQLIDGQFLPALDTSRKVVDGAKALGWEPLVAEALIAHGSAMSIIGNFSDAVKTWGDATWTAIRAGVDDKAAMAALATALITSDQLGDPGKAVVWLDLAIAHGTRLGSWPSFELERYEVEGVVRMQAGDITRGIAAHEKAQVLAEQVHGKGNPILWEIDSHLGTSYGKAGAYGKALPYFERALASREVSAGSNHLVVATLLSNLGLCYERTKQYAKARKALERSIEIRTALFDGMPSPILAVPLDNLGVLTSSEGNPAAAIPIFERSLGLAEMLPGPTHPQYHQALTDYAEALTAARRFPDAHAAYDRVLVLERDNHSPLLAHSQSSRAELALAESAWADAVTWAERSIASFESAGGKDNPLLWLPLTRLAEAKLATGDKAGAREALARAITLGERYSITPEQLERTRADLKRALE